MVFFGSTRSSAFCFTGLIAQFSRFGTALEYSGSADCNDAPHSSFLHGFDDERHAFGQGGATVCSKGAYDQIGFLYRFPDAFCIQDAAQDDAQFFILSFDLIRISDEGVDMVTRFKGMVEYAASDAPGGTEQQYIHIGCSFDFTVIVI